MTRDNNMNDDIVVQKILKLLENNTAFIGYALNGGVGTKINVRNTETGKTIQALSINVDSTGEVLVVKDSEDNQYKAVTFKTAEKVSERIIQLRKTKPVDDKKEIEYTDSDIEVFYLFVKLIDTGSPVPTDLTSTWIRKGSSCTQFVGAYERCNYAAKDRLNGVSYTGLPFKTHETLQSCLNDDGGRDARTPHGTSDENGGNPGWRIYSTRMTLSQEQELLAALESHDNAMGTSYKNLFGYGSILECSGAMYVQGWQVSTLSSTGETFLACDFSYLPGFTTECNSQMQNAGYCDMRGFIGSKTPLFNQVPPGQPSVGNVDNSWGHEYGWVNLDYEFKYKRHFFPLYGSGSHAKGSFLIIEGLNDDQEINIPEGYFPWVPGCPSPLAPGPYDGSGGNRFPDGVPEPKKRDMKLSTHKAEIWLGSSKKTEAIKLYELGVSDLFSGMYNALIMQADETRVDSITRFNSTVPPTEEDLMIHEKFYQNWNKNRLDLLIDPKVWVFIMDNKPKAGILPSENASSINQTNLILNSSLQDAVMHLYNRTLNLSIVDQKTQIIHLKLGLKPANTLSNTECKGAIDSGFGYSYPSNPFHCGQSWEYQKFVTIKIKDWKIESTTNTLDLTDIDYFWNKDYISRKFLTSFGHRNSVAVADNVTRSLPTSLLLRPTSSINLQDVLDGDNYEQWNYSVAKRLKEYYRSEYEPYFYIDSFNNTEQNTFAKRQQNIGLGTYSWWELWNKSYYSKKDKRLNSIVGYDRNYYQIANNCGLGLGLDYLTSVAPYNLNNVIIDVEYYAYLENLPQKYVPSIISQIRKKIIPNGYYESLKSREAILNKLGLNFFFTSWNSGWTASDTISLDSFDTIPYPSDNYNRWGYSIFASTTTYEYLFRKVAQRGGRVRGVRFDTLQWINYLWAQFIYDGNVKVDVDSYKKVEFSLYSPLNKYIKYTIHPDYATSEYSFITQQPSEDTNVETVLSPGTLDITKQVKITKPTNVDLDPNMSFLLYIYPFVEVTKKKKTI